jgi:hypothetical protein
MELPNATSKNRLTLVRLAGEKPSLQRSAPVGWETLCNAEEHAP